ncbi:MAG: CBS domain-containing protein [Gammaproteobacteria bacterium]|nr:CBS domain-containing protein [Gammaproteobacteria bacterium]
MNRQEPVRVKHVMTSEFLIVDGLMMVDQALKLMKENDARALIIDKRDENDEYGIALLSDVAREVLSRDRAPERVNVYEVMSKPVVSVNPEMDIRYCARLLNKLKFTYVPVIDNDKVLGIVGFSALVLNGLVK